MSNFIMGIASQAYRTGGALTLQPDPTTASVRGGERRLSRSKTLDGGVVITDGGYTSGDKTININLKSSRELWEALWSIFEGALWVTVTTDEACYLAKLEQLKEADGKISISIMVKETLS